MAGALSLDDQLLGEKMHYYCSSSEDEAEPDKNGADEPNDAINPLSLPQQSKPGASCNTGPKGVIADWQRYKQLKAEEKSEQEQELLALQKKLSMTCRSHLDDEKADEDEDEMLKELETLDDDFTKEYQRKRAEEMKRMLTGIPQFGNIIELHSAEEFHDASENVHPLSTVIIFVYEQNSLACDTMNGCLQCLSKEHPSIKFCKVLAHKASLSSKFSEEGVPALLVYKKGELIQNHVALHNVLGDDFFACDVSQLLDISSLEAPKGFTALK